MAHFSREVRPNFVEHRFEFIRAKADKSIPGPLQVSPVRMLPRAPREPPRHVNYDDTTIRGLELFNRNPVTKPLVQSGFGPSGFCKRR